MAANLKQLIQDFIIPEFRTLGVEIKRIDDRISSLRNELLAEIRRLDERISGVEKRLDTALNLHERIARLEAMLSKH